MTTQSVALTVDSVLFTLIADKLHVLLVKRATEPFIGQWALPGGIIDPAIDNSTDFTARRKLKEKTGVYLNYLEQLNTYSGPLRDPRGFTVTVAYYALTHAADLSPEVESVEQAEWIDVDELVNTSIGFDHETIIRDAVERLKNKAKYSLVPLYCLPKQFSIPAFTNAVSAILGKPIQRKTIQRRLEALDVLREVNGLQHSRAGKGAQLYELTKDIADINFERNLC